jgi:hypothetical protein
MNLNPQQDRVDLDAALRAYEQGAIPLSSLRSAAETIVDRWRDPAARRPEFTDGERPLWNVVWEIVTGCREALGPGGVARLRAMLEGEIDLRNGGEDLRP